MSGTLAYMAPERFRGRPADPASDWFSFGVMLFEALVGQLPFGPNPQQTVVAWFTGKRVANLKERLGDLARPFVELVEALLDPEPRHRPNGADVLSALDGYRTSTTADRVFGREQHLDWLLESVSSSPPRVNVTAITGESGIGKTSLLRQLLAQCRERGHLVLSACCHPREHLPFNALNEIVTELVRACRHLDGLDAPALDAMQRLADVFINDPGQTRDDPHRPTLRQLAQDLEVLLRSCADQRPVVVAIDDAQRMDQDSLPIMLQLFESAYIECSYLLAVRGDSDDVPAPLRQHVGNTRHLDRLDAPTALALAKHLLPGATDDELTMVCTAARGHPFAIEQACTLSRSRRQLRSDTTPEELVYHQLTEQSDHQQRVLSLLAVHEGWLPSEVLYACRLHSVSDVYELLDAGLLNFRRVENNYAVSIRHARLAEFLRGNIESEKLRHAHHVVANAYLEVLPGEVEDVFRHLVNAGRIEEALPFGRESAHAFRDRLAFHRAAQLFRWLIDHETDATRRLEHQLELAEVLARAGIAGQAADTYLSAAGQAVGDARVGLLRNAAEQLLRAGDKENGRELLAECAREVGLPMPRSRAQQLARIAWHRLRIHLASPQPVELRNPPPAVQRRMEVAWSLGLGLNLLDIIGSGLAQSQYTSLALCYGNDDQVARAWSVEYSYAMNAAGLGASRKGERLRELMTKQLSRTKDAYTRGIVLLSWAAGDYFRGRFDLALDRSREARTVFSSQLGSLSWEMANCGLYEMWSAFELGRLDEFSARVPELLRLGEERGDALYRRFWVGGHCATAWLIADRPQVLRTELGSNSVLSSRFEMNAMFTLLAQVRTDLYDGRYAEARMDLERAWKGIQQSGMLHLQWFRFTLGLLRLQATVVSDGPATRRELGWASAFSRCKHPAARHWSAAFAAALRMRGSGGFAREHLATIANSADALAAKGHHLAALALRQQLSMAGYCTSPRWPACVVSPERLSSAIGIPLIPQPA